MKLLILVGTVALAAAQNCAGPIADYGDCIAAAKATNSFGNHRGDFGACFTNNGCRDPSVDKEASRACKKDVLMRAVGNQMKSCAANNGIALRGDFLKMAMGGRGGHHKGFGGRGGRGLRGRRGDKMEAKIAAACQFAGPMAADNVRVCLEQAKAAKMAEWQANRGVGGGWPRGGNSAYSQCTLSAECQAAMEAQKATLCQCGQTLANDQFLVDSVKRDLMSCQSAESDDSHEDRNPLQGILKKFCGRMGGRGGRGRGGWGGGRAFDRGGNRWFSGRANDQTGGTRRGRWNRG